MALFWMANKALCKIAGNKFQLATTKIEKSIGFGSKFVWETSWLYSDTIVVTAAAMRLSEFSTRIFAPPDSSNAAHNALYVGMALISVGTVGLTIMGTGAIVVPAIVLVRCGHSTFIKKNLYIMKFRRN